jgi:hypothetical protein
MLLRLFVAGAGVVIAAFIAAYPFVLCNPLFDHFPITPTPATIYPGKTLFLGHQKRRLEGRPRHSGVHQAVQLSIG